MRFRSRAAPADTGYCHCTLCQRSTGAPVLAWASFPVATFAYTAGTPATYRSSPHGQREFCGRCGTQIAYRERENARFVDVNVGSLDDAAEVRPACHIWYASRLPWFDTRDDLPRYAGGKPGDKPA